MFTFSQLNYTSFDSVPEMLTEGPHDPGVLKAVFMAGGPGSGKSFVANELFGIDSRFKASFSTFGLKVVNNDAAFEYLLGKNGIDPSSLAKIEKENPALWNSIANAAGGIRDRAKQITQKQAHLFEQARLGMIIDGTGDNYTKYANYKSRLESLGYDCLLVFVNTSLEVALQRNQARDRKLPDSLVKEIWNDCQKNIGGFQALFGRNNMIIVDKTNSGRADENIHKIVRAFMAQPIKNPAGQYWLRVAKTSEKY